VPGGLAKSRKTDDFSRRMRDLSVDSDGYTGEFLERGHILAVCEVKYVAVRPNFALITVRGLPSDRAAAMESPVREVCAIRKKLPPDVQSHKSKRGKDKNLIHLYAQSLTSRKQKNHPPQTRGAATPSFSRYSASP
jgi:hypothetical protein